MKILESLKKQHIKTGGHCGLYISFFEGDLKVIKVELNKLFINKKITIHDGIHGQLIKYNEKGTYKTV